MKRFVLLLTLCGCLPPRTVSARLLPSALSLQAQGELAAERSNAVGTPTARSGRQDDAAWSALLVAVWRDRPSDAPLAFLVPPAAEGWSLDPNGSADPAGSGLSWTTYSIEPGAQP
jgi:hypothetical protein